MAKDNNLTDFLTDVANAIRNKTGKSNIINPQTFTQEIDNIETGLYDPILKFTVSHRDTVTLFNNRQAGVYVFKFNDTSPSADDPEGYFVVENTNDNIHINFKKSITTPVNSLLILIHGNYEFFVIEAETTETSGSLTYSSTFFKRYFDFSLPLRLTWQGGSSGDLDFSGTYVGQNP